MLLLLLIRVIMLRVYGINHVVHRYVNIMYISVGYDQTKKGSSNILWLRIAFWQIRSALHTRMRILRKINIVAWLNTSDFHVNIKQYLRYRCHGSNNNAFSWSFIIGLCRFYSAFSFSPINGISGYVRYQREQRSKKKKNDKKREERFVLPQGTNNRVSQACPQLHTRVPSIPRRINGGNSGRGRQCNPGRVCAGRARQCR